MSMSRNFPEVKGVCPACGRSSSLFVGLGGYLTCSHLDCPDPSAASTVLSTRVLPDRLVAWHTVTVKADGWHMAHPLWCDLERCAFDAAAQEWDEPPRGLGTYAWATLDDGPWQWAVVDRA